MDSVVASYSAPLSEGFGYGIVLGLGIAFALGMIGTTWALKRYQNPILLRNWEYNTRS